jgi:hypothetical protein
MDKTLRPRASKTLKLAGQHRLVVSKSAERHTLQLVTTSGSNPITIEVTSEGIALKIEGPDIALQASGALSLSAQKLRLEGRGGVEIASGGDLRVAAEGTLTNHAGAIVNRAVRGCIDVKASDDVKLSGERVMVNCDDTVNRYYREPSRLDQPAQAKAALPEASRQAKASKQD